MGGCAAQEHAVQECGRSTPQDGGRTVMEDAVQIRIREVGGMKMEGV